MEKLSEICIVLLLTSLLIPHFANAAEPEEPIIVEPIINIDLQGVIDAILGTGETLETTVKESTGRVGSAVLGVPEEVFSIFTDSFRGSLREFNSALLSLAEALLSANPDPSPLYPWWQTIVLAISCFYLLIFLLVGLMFLFSSISPEKRYTAKEWLKGAFMMIIGVNISFHLYTILLGLATAITQYIWISGFEGFFEGSIFMGVGIIFLTFISGAVILALLTLFIRYIFLFLGVVIFPIGIFLYFIPPLRPWGKLVFNLIGVALFMQFIDVVVLVVCNYAASQLAWSEAAAALVPALSFIFIAIINTLLVLYAVLKAAFSATENSSILAFAFGAIAGQISSVLSATKQTAQPQGG